MPLCNTCTTANGEEHRCERVITKWPNPKSAESKDICAHCDPDMAHEKMRSPVDQKIWLMADVNPNEYEYGIDGVRRMKDWADGEFGERLARDDEFTPEQIADAKARKRAEARAGRRRPLTEGEIKQLQAAYDPQENQSIQ